MKIGIQGTNRFSDYSIDYPVFLRAMGNALRDLKEDDKELIVFSAGPLAINRFAQEFLNVSENSLKARGIKIKFIKVPPSWMKTNIKELNHFNFFCKPKESLSPLVDLADSKDVQTGVYRF